MIYRTILAASIMAAALVGCAKDGGANARRNPADLEAAKEPPMNANTHFAAGQLAESRGELSSAIYQYKLALRQNPDHSEALFHLGSVYAATKQFGPAIETWKRYLKATGESASAYSDLAFCEELAGNPKAAEADYLRGIRKDPNNESCHVNYGLMLTRHARMNEAVLQLQAVLSPAEVHYDLAGVYEFQGRRELARSEYQRAVDLDPNFSDARSKLARLN
jgi:tetratricopeptide (TPR) repeat protein